MDAFDADIVIFASVGDRRGDPLLSRITPEVGAPLGVGSVLLLPETLSMPPTDLRGRTGERRRLLELLARLLLLPVTDDVAVLSAELRAAYRLKTPDAVHLATAIIAGADRFATNNRRDFTSRITEIDIAFPELT